MESLEIFTKKHRNILWIGLVFILILAILLHRFSTWRWGVGVSHDSIFYISASENFLIGNGISRIGGGNEVKPLTHFPPLYPLSLSLLGYFIGVREAADWCAAILFGINAVLIALIIFQASKSIGASLVGGLFALISPLLLDIHFEAMSEPLYIFSTLVCLSLLASCIKNQKNWLLIFAAAAASLAYLTRYIGVSVLLTGLLSLVLMYPGAFQTKFKKAAIFGTIAFVPNLIWYVRNYLRTGSLTNRVLTFHPITQDKINEGLLSVGEWIFPSGMPKGLGLGMVVFFFIIVGVGFALKSIDMKNGKSDDDVVQDNPIAKLIVIHFIVYIAMLFTSLTFFDISTRLNNRILIPLYVMFLLLSMISLQRIFVSSRITLRRIVYLMSAVLLGLVAIVYVARSWDLVRGMRQEGSGFNSASWRNSEIIAILKTFDSDAIVYSNEAFPVYYLTGIGAYGIPEKFDPVRSEARDDFQRSMEVMRERLRDPNSAIVVFHQGYLREGMPSLDEIAEGFVIAHESRDGVIFVYPENLLYWQFD